MNRPTPPAPEPSAALGLSTSHCTPSGHVRALVERSLELFDTDWEASDAPPDEVLRAHVADLRRWLDKETTMTTATYCTDTACPIPVRHEGFEGHTPEDSLRRMGLTPDIVTLLRERSEAIVPCADCGAQPHEGACGE